MDYLINPKDSVTTENYYETEAYYGGLAGVYQVMTETADGLD